MWFSVDFHKNGEAQHKGLPHITKIKRKPEGVGAEMKVVADGDTGCILGVDIMKGKERMAMAYEAEHQAGTCQVSKGVFREVVERGMSERRLDFHIVWPLSELDQYKNMSNPNNRPKRECMVEKCKQKCSFFCACNDISRSSADNKGNQCFYKLVVKRIC